MPYISPDGTLHETYRVLPFLGNRSLGESSFDPGAWPGLRYRRSGLAFFCPTCGDIWARIVLVQESGAATSFEIQVTSCERHSDQWQVPGSLVPVGREAWLEILPAEAVRREMEVHLKWR